MKRTGPGRRARAFPVHAKSNIGNKDIIAEVNQEVKLWAEGKLAEIDRLRDLEKYRKDFVGNVSHELKTPIFNIQGYILTLLDGGLEDPKINRLYLERTEKSIDRMFQNLNPIQEQNFLMGLKLIPNFCFSRPTICFSRVKSQQLILRISFSRMGLYSFLVMTINLLYPSIYLLHVSI